MRFRIVGEDIWREGKLVLENNTLIFYELKQKKGVFLRIRGKEKGEEVLKINISSIKDVKKEDKEELMLGYEGASSSEEGSQLAYVQVRMRAEAINDLEREILMRMNAKEFSVFFAQTLTKEMRLRKGILKLSPFALWLIDREGQKRIEWDVVVNVEEKKRGKYKGIEYAAISIEYIDEDSKVKSSLIISKGDIRMAIHHLSVLKDFPEVLFHSSRPTSADFEGLFLRPTIGTGTSWSRAFISSLGWPPETQAASVIDG